MVKGIDETRETRESVEPGPFRLGIGDLLHSTFVSICEVGERLRDLVFFFFFSFDSSKCVNVLGLGQMFVPIQTCPGPRRPREIFRTGVSGWVGVGENIFKTKETYILFFESVDNDV